MGHYVGVRPEWSKQSTPGVSDQQRSFEIWQFKDGGLWQVTNLPRIHHSNQGKVKDEEPHIRIGSHRRFRAV